MHTPAVRQNGQERDESGRPGLLTGTGVPPVVPGPRRGRRTSHWEREEAAACWPLVVLLTLFAGWGAVHYTVRTVDERVAAVIQPDAFDPAVRDRQETDSERIRALRAGMMFSPGRARSESRHRRIRFTRR